MAVRGRSSADRTTRWDVLVTNAKQQLPDMPYIADDLKTLEGMLSEVRGLETQQEDLRSQARKSNSDLKKKLREGDKVRARLGSTFKGKLGFADDTLRKYGFKPLPEVRKRKSSAKKPADRNHRADEPGPRGDPHAAGADAPSGDDGSGPEQQVAAASSRDSVVHVVRTGGPQGPPYGDGKIAAKFCPRGGVERP